MLKPKLRRRANTPIGPDTGAVFTACDVAAVVRCCFDHPVRANSLTSAAGNDRLVGDVEGGFAGTVQQPVTNVPGVDNSFDADNRLGVRLPVVVLAFSGGVEDANGAALIAIAAPIMTVVRTERRRDGGDLTNPAVK